MVAPLEQYLRADNAQTLIGLQHRHKARQELRTETRVDVQQQNMVGALIEGVPQCDIHCVREPMISRKRKYADMWEFGLDGGNRSVSGSVIDEDDSYVWICLTGQGAQAVENVGTAIPADQNDPQ